MRIRAPPGVEVLTANSCKCCVTTDDVATWQRALLCFSRRIVRVDFERLGCCVGRTSPLRTTGFVFLGGPLDCSYFQTGPVGGELGCVKWEGGNWKKKKTTTTNYDISNIHNWLVESGVWRLQLDQWCCSPCGGGLSGPARPQLVQTYFSMFSYSCNNEVWVYVIMNSDKNKFIGQKFKLTVLENFGQKLETLPGRSESETRLSPSRFRTERESSYYR